MENNKFSVSIGFYLMLALMFLLMPFRWIFSAIVAAIFHECCHYAAIRLLCKQTAAVKLYSYGARMPLPEMNRGKEMLCAMAGPVGGLFLTVFASVFPRLAVCAFLQSVFNLLPIYPLDGGRVISAILSMIFPPPKAVTIIRIIGICVKIGICLAALYGCFSLHLGVFPLLVAALMCIRIK